MKLTFPLSLLRIAAYIFFYLVLFRTGAADNDIALIQLEPDPSDISGKCIRRDQNLVRCE